jgi:hypothetical protein
VLGHAGMCRLEWQRYRWAGSTASRGCTGCGTRVRQDSERSRWGACGARAARGAHREGAAGGVGMEGVDIEDPTPNPTRRRGGRGRGLHLGLLDLALWPVAPCLGYHRAAQHMWYQDTSQTGLGLNSL